jgi:hypothetical protein
MMARQSLQIISIMVMLLVCILSARAATISKEDAAKILQEGNYMFMKANELAKEDPWQAKDLYQKAATHFESLATDSGIKNGKLYYNIGNAYFMANDVGRAILYYKKSFALNPNDANLAQNLEFARSKRVDKIDIKESSKIFEIVFFWHFDIPEGVRLAIFLLTFAVVWVCLGFRFFFRHALLHWGTILAGIVTLMFFGSLVADAFTAANSKPGVVISGEVTARKGDGETYEPSFQAPLHAGTEFNLVESRRGWDNIELADGRRAWVPANTVGIVDRDYKPSI